MKLTLDALIPEAKLTDYLLAFKQRNDKSRWLGLAGYSQQNWWRLEADLREQILTLMADLVEENRYGTVYEIRGTLTGPNGRELSVRSVWITERESGQTKFVTLFPDKRRGV